MKNVLILDTNPLPLDSSVMGLSDNYNDFIRLEEVKFIYQVIRKLLFRPNQDEKTTRNHYDLLIIGFTSPDKDMEKVHFIRYLKRNKPDLPLLIYSHNEKAWLMKQRLTVENDELALVADHKNIGEVLGNFLKRGVLS